MSKQSILGIVRVSVDSGRPGECANAYDEDTWTTRLFHCLSTGLEGFSGKIFTNLMGRGTASAVIKETCPPGVPEEGFLFRGDFTISWNKETTGSPVMIPQNTDESELDTSGDSGRGEHAHHMSPNNVYRDGSLILNKGGELIAAIHQCILLKVLWKLMNKKHIKLPLVGNGFYIHKVTEPYTLN